MSDSQDFQMRCLAEIGLITLKWNDLEQACEHLIWHYIGDHEKGHVITGGMGNATRLETLKALCDIGEAIPEVKTHIACFCAAFDILRLNRNAVVHSVGYGLTHKGNAFLFERLKRSVRTREFNTMSLPLESLSSLTDQIVHLTEYGQTLEAIMRDRGGLIDQPFFDWPKPPPWPEKFQLPQKLA